MCVANPNDPNATCEFPRLPAGETRTDVSTALPPHPRGREGSRDPRLSPTGAGSGARGRGQLLPPHPRSWESARSGAARGPVGHCGAGWVGKVGGPAPRPSLPGARRPLLGHPSGARPSARSLRTWPLSPPPPGPSPGRRASASWRTGLARGPGKRVQLAAAPPAVASRQWLPAFPRPASERQSSAAALFPPLPGTGQTGFSAPGWCLQSLTGSRGWGWGRARPSALPLSLPGAERGWTASPRAGTRGPGPAPRPLCALAAGGHPGGAPNSSPASPDLPLGSCDRCRLLWRSRLPGGRASHPAPPASRHFPAALGWPGRRPGSVTSPARKAGRAAARLGPAPPPPPR